MLVKHVFLIYPFSCVINCALLSYLIFVFLLKLFFSLHFILRIYLIIFYTTHLDQPLLLAGCIRIYFCNKEFEINKVVIVTMKDKIISACWNCVNYLKILCMYWVYTCQLSHIMRKSRACGLKTSILRIKDNFSRLTHKSGQLVV